MSDTNTARQWRNINKVVRALADLCFGDKNHPQWGVAYISIVNSLTAKDGIDISALNLETLSEPEPRKIVAYRINIKTSVGLVKGNWVDGEPSQDVMTVVNSIPDISVLEYAFSL